MTVGYRMHCRIIPNKGQTMHSVFDVKNNVQTFGKAYAFHYARKQVGTIHALWLLWVAGQMVQHDAKKFRINII